jgi:hypothetical protein
MVWQRPIPLSALSASKYGFIRVIFFPRSAVRGSRCSRKLWYSHHSLHESERAANAVTVVVKVVAGSVLHDHKANALRANERRAGSVLHDRKGSALHDHKANERRAGSVLHDHKGSVLHDHKANALRKNERHSQPRQSWPSQLKSL